MPLLSRPFGAAAQRCISWGPIVVMLTALPMWSANAAPVQPPRPVAPESFDPRRSLAPLVAAVQPAVVKIEVRGTGGDVPEVLRELLGDPGPEGEGSGFIIDEKGILLTNHHVVAGGGELRIVLHDGTTVGATVLGSDEDLDIAVLQLEGDRDWPAVALADSAKVRVGDWVVALGNTLGLGTTATTGIVSGKGRRLHHDRFGQDDFLQTDAAINQGNSGGPLFDLEGRVIGMNTAVIAGANTVGFAISSNLIALVLDDLRDKGRVSRGYLGVETANLSTERRTELGIRSDHGVLVAEVVDKTPASSAGLKTGDVIVGVDDRTIDTRNDLLVAIAGKRPGERIQLEVERNGGRKRLSATLAERPAPPPPEAPPLLPGPAGELGLRLSALPRDLAAAAGVRKGVLIEEVVPNSAAANRLFAGDIIVEINRRSVDSVEKVQRLLRRSSEKAYFQVIRGDAQYFVEIPTKR